MTSHDQAFLRAIRHRWLNAQERWQLIGLLWDSLPDDAPLTPPAGHIRELEERIAEADVIPGAGEAWDSVYTRLSSKS